MNGLYYLSQATENVGVTSAKGIDFNSIMMNAFPMVLIFIVFYFFIIRPQKKKQQEHQEMISKLTSGAEVLLSSGVYGKISSMPLDKDFCFVEVAENTVIKIERKEITKVIQ